MPENNWDCTFRNMRKKVNSVKISVSDWSSNKGLRFKKRLLITTLHSGKALMSTFWETVMIKSDQPTGVGK